MTQAVVQGEPLLLPPFAFLPPLPAVLRLFVPLLMVLQDFVYPELFDLVVLRRRRDN
jgi:hypothetical protein